MRIRLLGYGLVRSRPFAWHEAVADKQRDSTARRLVFRIRIHAGEVIVRDGDLFGEGVNIAARLESLADPGGTVVSAGVYREVRGKLARRSKTEAGIG